jgi:4-hydroxy-3-polyprenylbenzoate decarboxylase
VWPVLETVMQVSGGGWPKIAIAVDEDIDPRDLETVFWALSVRHQPHRDIRIVERPSRGAGMDESIAPRDVPEEELASYKSSYMLIDATRKWANPPISLPRREYMDRARFLWEQLELPALKPREPWYGMSLGFWPEEQEELVALAEQGREEEAAELLLSRGRQLEGTDPIRGYAAGG